MSDSDRPGLPEAQDDIRNRPMHTEDKVLLAILAIFLPAIALGLIFVCRWIMAGMFGMAVGASEGVGFRDAFISAIVISTLLMIVFALVAGDGAMGELATMIVGFFLMVTFFTVAIALVL